MQSHTRIIELLVSLLWFRRSQKCALQSDANVGTGTLAASSPADSPTRRSSWRKPVRLLVLPALLAFLVLATAVAATIGAAGIPLHRLAAAVGLTQGDPSLVDRDWLVLWSIRLPRIAMAIIVGGLLAAAGAMLQGMFRNPLADPALVGVSNGAAFASAAMIVVGDRYIVSAGATLPVEVLPLAAFAGALAATMILYRIATHEGRTSIAMFLLGGLAIAALANAGLGLLIFLADDRQLRDINFWLLGSLGGATWPKVGATVPFLVVIGLAMPFISRGLDLLVLGETEAFHAGIEVERLKRICIVLVAAATGAAVSVSGVILFVGLVVPHLLRLVIGPSHRLLLPAAVLLGAVLLVVADTFARTLAAPAELPIGIVTATVGAPFFLYLLLRQRALLA
jgi:iron complex transport system permease protein